MQTREPIVFESAVPETMTGRSPFLDVDDGGQAVIVSIDPEDEDSRMEVRLQSWVDLSDRITGHEQLLRKAHPQIAAMLGKRVRVTVEILD